MYIFLSVSPWDGGYYKRMLVVLTGTLGQGKTLSMSVLALYLKQQSGLKVYANYSLTGSIRVRTFKELLECESGILAFDEAHISFDSRLYKDNVKSTHWFAMTRKKGLIVMMTTQTFGQIDLRMRNLTDYLIVCKKTDTGVWLQLINWQERKLMHRVHLDNIKRFFTIYDTYEIINTISA